MSEDWQAGDLALCVRDDWQRDDGLPEVPGRVHPRSGGIYTVDVVHVPCDDCGAVYLVLAGFVPAYHADNFRRIAPLTNEEHRKALADLDLPVIA